MQVADNSSDLRSRLSTLYFTRPYRRFLVSRMGSTGSTWLVKLLNSHPDVFCYHEGALSGIFPRETYGSEDIVRFIEFLAQEEMHGAYKAMGDVGSAWVDHLTALPRGTFTTAILLRHPARLLNTRLKIFKADKSFTEIDKSLLSQVERAWGIKASSYDEMDQIFLQDAFIFASQIQAIKLVDLVIHIGQMKEIDYCRDVLHRLTGLHYEHSLVARAIARPVNRRSGSRHASVKEILSSFSNEQRAWYRLMLEEVLPVCGYALEEDEEDELQSPELAIGVEEGESGGPGDSRAELQSLKQALVAKERQIAQLVDQVEDLQRLLTSMQNSAGWRLLDRWRQLSRRLLPDGSWRRKSYDSLMGLLAAKLIK